MKISILYAGGCVMALAAVGLILWGTLPRKEASSLTDRQAEIVSLREVVAELKAERESLRADIADLQDKMSAVTDTMSIRQGDNEEGAPKAVLKTGESSGESSAAMVEGKDPQGAVTEEAPADVFSLDEAIDKLLDPALDWDGRQPVWNELAARGLVDEALAVFEEQAKENPEDPNVHAELGNAYIQKLMSIATQYHALSRK